MTKPGGNRTIYSKVAMAGLLAAYGAHPNMGSAFLDRPPSSGWKEDPERLAAAIAKRERKAKRNARNASGERHG